MIEMAEQENRLYMMKLHDRIGLDDNNTVLRVPGGWIYYNHIKVTEEDDQLLTSTAIFVPLNNEFKTNFEFVGRKMSSR